MGAGVRASALGLRPAAPLSTPQPLEGACLWVGTGATAGPPAIKHLPMGEK